MRFLCFHGRGTNAKTFESQTAAIRYELGDGHEFEFIEGTTPAELAPELKDTMTGDFTPLFYCHEMDPASVLGAGEQLSRYLDAEGPFDGVMGFSLGAAFIATWMLDQVARGRELPFRCAVFFSSSLPGNAAAMRAGQLEAVRGDSSAAGAGGGIIPIPTAHIWGTRDALAGDMPSELFSLCAPATRSVFVHGGGHEVPASEANVTLAVNAIRRCILLAQEEEEDY
ncbi:serine hydrolase FSH [Podospora appendiculata]|uniref:Serine hydrolase FSH n=1 Tax=Podospora appendiculata TaxID=314037 RepID=A0AAE0X8H5_9PEZI|nr:serine hydrolase FSH [Podospora appendiculata]